MRPIKQGLSYFPLDVDVDTDDKIVLIESRFGTEGFTVVIKLLMKIYKEGYFYRWTERELLLFSQRIKVEEPVVDAIVKDCIKWDLFNKKLFNKYQILTSLGIQERFFEAVKRRLKINVCKEYTLIPVIEYINKDNVNIYSVNDDISTQSKVKKKEKESKAKYMEHVLLTKTEHKSLVEKFGEEGCNDRIEDLNYYVGSKGIAYKSHYMTILSWEKKNFKINKKPFEGDYRV
mgnify:CR=1 FL=1